ncbi:uncharacterized protein FA14DRAFT_177769 [Meira miltonrushii]|uniref:Uncharacterized protein n=1 Tax=Meira miltonrushii TaxID=1280837 RepID=A0A316VLJ3_9BASI|nr:uncharacterized protein FA14DRAFT_177769 [Meira miltonrushii]PWN38499.1 hypothetical protein FA14DRAFT_177769 [Meira miltonrushii]
MQHTFLLKIIFFAIGFKQAFVEASPTPGLGNETPSSGSPSSSKTPAQRTSSQPLKISVSSMDPESKGRHFYEMKKSVRDSSLRRLVEKGEAKNLREASHIRAKKNLQVNLKTEKSGSTRKTRKSQVKPVEQS